MGNEGLTGAVDFVGPALAIVTGSMSGIVILKLVASRNTFLEVAEHRTRNGN
jgi:hypothetical protein